jgi:hypothetical protein
MENNIKMKDYGEGTVYYLTKHINTPGRTGTIEWIAFKKLGKAQGIVKNSAGDWRKGTFYHGLGGGYIECRLAKPDEIALLMDKYYGISQDKTYFYTGEGLWGSSVLEKGNEVTITGFRYTKHYYPMITIEMHSVNAVNELGMDFKYTEGGYDFSGFMTSLDDRPFDDKPSTSSLVSAAEDIRSLRDTVTALKSSQNSLSMALNTKIDECIRLRQRLKGIVIFGKRII